MMLIHPCVTFNSTEWPTAHITHSVIVDLMEEQLILLPLAVRQSSADRHGGIHKVYKYELYHIEVWQRVLGGMCVAMQRFLLILTLIKE